MSLLLIVALAASSVGIDEHVGTKLPAELAFTDTSGAQVELGSLFDGHRPVVLVLAYARCRMLCSVVLRGVSQEIASTPGDYLPVVVSLDPHEQPADARAHHDALVAQAGRPWPYLTGDDKAIHALADALGFRYAWDAQTEQYAHPAVVFVLTPDGRIAEYLRGVVYPDLAAAIDRARSGELTTATAQDVISCFHFDPSLRRYQHKIALLFGLGGAVVLFGLGSLLAWLSRLERRRR